MRSMGSILQIHPSSNRGKTRDLKIEFATPSSWPMTKARTEVAPTKLGVWLLRMFVFVPASVFGYVVGVPLHLVLEYAGRKHCPRCGKRNLSGALVRDAPDSRPWHFGICMSCNSQYRYTDGKWDYIGPFEESS